jgi:hypothetical protein
MVPAYLPKFLETFSLRKAGEGRSVRPTDVPGDLATIPCGRAAVLEGTDVPDPAGVLIIDQRGFPENVSIPENAGATRSGAPVNSAVPENNNGVPKYVGVPEDGGVFGEKRRS